MLRRIFRSRFFSKVFYELLPAAIVSVLGTFLINKYARPADPPQPLAAAPANAELVQLLREQQALLTDYLKKTAEARERTGPAAVPEAETLKAAERAAAQALREAKAAEARALAAARASAEAQERKLARQPLQQPAQSPTGEPLQLHPAISAVTPREPLPPVAAPMAPPVPPRENAAVSTLRGAVSVIERIPGRVVDWFIDASPPRPPADLPPRNFTKAAM
jgi:hypothetical protein